MNRNLALQAVLQLIPSVLRQSLLDSIESCERLGVSTDARITFGNGELELSRNVLFNAVRAAFSPGHEGVNFVDTSGKRWLLTITESEDGPETVLSGDDVRCVLPYFWPLHPSREIRLKALEGAVRASHCGEDVLQTWWPVLSQRAVTNDEYALLDGSLRSTPAGVFEGLREAIFSGQAGLDALVPIARRYYEDLVGVAPGPDQELSDYVEGIAKEHIERLLSWDRFEGAKLALLLSSHSLFTDALARGLGSNDDMDRLLIWGAEQGDLISRAALIEIGLSKLDGSGRYEDLIEQLVHQMDFNADDEQFSLTSALSTFVYGRLAFNCKMRDVKPYWRRLAAFAQSGLIERCLMVCPVDRAALTSELEARGLYKYFHLQAVVDLRIEPRWLPQYLDAEQLRFELLGRVESAARTFENAIASHSLRDVLLGDGPGGLRSRLKFPYAYLPGPLEGGVKATLEMPEEIRLGVEKQLTSPELRTESFNSLVNCVLLFRVGTEHAELAASAIRDVKYQIRNFDDSEKAFQMLTGLAVVSCVTRSHALADEIQVLARILRRRSKDSMARREEFLIAMVAAGSRETLQPWLEFVGGWLEELAFSDMEREAAKWLHSQIQVLCEVEPRLSVVLARAEAALAGAF